MEPSQEAVWNESSLDSLISDFRAHIARLGAVDCSAASAGDVMCELRDNAYPSLKALAEEVRELEDDLAGDDSELGQLQPEQVVQLAATIGSAGEIAVVTRELLPKLDEADADRLRVLVDRFEASARIAVAILERLLEIGDEASDGVSIV